MSDITPEKMRLLAVVAPTWTDYLARAGAAKGIRRQCSIGWHEECSDPEGEDCSCHCHLAPEVFAKLLAEKSDVV